MAVFKDRKGRVIGDIESAGVMEANDSAPRVRFYDPTDELKPPLPPDQEPDGPDDEPDPKLLEPEAPHEDAP